MSKITINEIEEAMKPELSLDQLKESGFEQGDRGRHAEQIRNISVVKELFYKLNKEEQQIARMIMNGYSKREICRMLEVSHHTIRATLDKIRYIIK